MPCRTAEFILFTSFAVAITSVNGLGFFDVSVVSLENTGGRLSNGECCARGSIDAPSNDSIKCPGICDTAVRVCLSPYRQGDELTSIGDDPDCSYGENSTEHGFGKSDLRFNDDEPNSILSVRFTYNWPGSTTLIVQLLHMRTEGSVQLIKKVIQPVELNATGNWTEFRSQSTPDEISRGLAPINFVYRVRVRCDSNFYGPNCNIKCVPHSGVHGHYECDQNGQKRCLPGWKNLASRCTEPICANGCRGGCDQPGECSKCPLGWTGPKCNRCKPYPGCVNGYCLTPNQCLCNERWGGLQCEDDLDYCFHKSPCQNGATCVPFERNNYTCECPAGFMGRDCEFEENPCRRNPCMNFGTCVVKSKFEFVCVCGRLHSGRRCEHLLAGKGEADPCVVDDHYYEHGQSWNLPGCRRCRCVDGFANCTKAQCQMENCLLRGNQCPDGQRCSPTSADPWSCLRGPCLAGSHGMCLPNDFDEAAAAKKQAACAQSGQNGHCSRLTLLVNVTNLPAGTYAHDICYHLLVFVFDRRFSQYHAVCSADPSAPGIVNVQVVSLKEQWPVAGFRSTLEDSFRGNQAAFQSGVLRAIIGIGDETGHMKDTTASFWTRISKHALIASICSIGLIICVLTIAACLLWRKVRSPSFRKSEMKHDSEKIQDFSSDFQLNNWNDKRKQCNLWAAARCEKVVEKDINFTVKQRQWPISNYDKEKNTDEPGSPSGRLPPVGAAVSEMENGSRRNDRHHLKTTMVTMEASV